MADTYYPLSMVILLLTNPVSLEASDISEEMRLNSQKTEDLDLQ